MLQVRSRRSANSALHLGVQTQKKSSRGHHQMQSKNLHERRCNDRQCQIMCTSGTMELNSIVPGIGHAHGMDCDFSRLDLRLSTNSIVKTNVCTDTARFLEQMRKGWMFEIGQVTAWIKVCTEIMASVSAQGTTQVGTQRMSTRQVSVLSTRITDDSVC